ncbi:MAG: hypothetical protein SF066_03415 [Thermoanaerobaculia bacterium]|nr:hypothetical protein [Thermoanaerobaculia bacterium]
MRIWARVVALLVVLPTLGCRLGTTFDAEAWRDPKRVQAGDRRAMADRLLWTRALLGRSRTDVLALLGPPSSDGYFRDWGLVYWLGPERGYFGIDSEWLGLRLDAEERVIEARILTD